MIESDSAKLTRDKGLKTMNNYSEQEEIIKEFIEDVETMLRAKWQPYIVKNIDIKKPKENNCFLRYFCLFPKYK